MSAQPVDSRPRTIVTADPELDDQNSLIRLLLFSNEIRLEGLVYASSRFHWRGDGKGTPFFLPDREYAEPRTSFRWKEGERFIDDVVDAYAEVHANLAVHDHRYPDPGYLRSIIREGNVDFEGDTSAETPGSALIAEALLDDQPGPLYLQLWAGPSTVARALMSIEERFSGTDQWRQVHAAVSAKAVITKFASQDATYDDYISPRWPDIRVVDVGVAAWGYPVRYVLPEEDRQLLSAQWMRDNVTSVGPLGALYRVWGDGRQMVPGDLTDFFHESGKSAEELRAEGYTVWIDPQPAGEWISEGDTTNMLPLIAPGLRGHEHPSFGGWGGRARRTADGTDSWTLEGVVDESGAPESSLTRWFADAQADFAERLRWSVTGVYDAANHHPALEVTSGLDMAVRAGESVELTASVSDPDGDRVTCHWWQYREAGTYTGEVQITSVGTRASLVIPDAAESGSTIHIIVEVVDDAARPLKSYRRVILTVS